MDPALVSSGRRCCWGAGLGCGERGNRSAGRQWSRWRRRRLPGVAAAGALVGHAWQRDPMMALLGPNLRLCCRRRARLSAASSDGEGRSASLIAVPAR